jgi:hypothetical protein
VKWPHRGGTLVEGEAHAFISLNEMFPSSLLDVSTLSRRKVREEECECGHTPKVRCKHRKGA